MAGGSFTLPVAVLLGLLRQWMWSAESLGEVVTGLSVCAVLLFMVLLLPMPRKMLATLLSSPPSRTRTVPGARDKRAAAAAQQLQQMQQGGKGAKRAPEQPPPDIAFSSVNDGRRVRLTDSGQVFCMIHTTDKMIWPSTALKDLAGQTAWGDWKPFVGVEGSICHYWIAGAKPNEIRPERRCCLAMDLVVVRSTEPGSDEQHLFVSSVQGLEPADGNKEPLKLPRDGDTCLKSSGVL